MWLMTKYGFFSAVEDRDNDGVVIVRARDTGDIENLSEMLNIDYFYTPTADYPYRLRCSKEAWADVVARWASQIDYDNFKDAVKRSGQIRHANAYGQVWAEMLAIDDRDPFNLRGRI